MDEDFVNASAFTPCGLARLALALVLWCLIPGAASAPEKMLFNVLSRDEGLSQVTVNDIFQDSRGFLWFATENGLNRYDGRNMLQFHADPTDQDAIANDFIWSIVEDAAGDLWLATEGGGLVHWQRASETFTNIVVPGEDLDPRKRFARQVMIDSAGSLWVGTRGAGLLRFDGQGEFSNHYPLGSEQQSSAKDDVIYALLETSAGEFLVGASSGLYRFMLETGAFEKLPGSYVDVCTLYIDGKGRLWIGTLEQGLVRKNLETGEELAFNTGSEPPARLANNEIRDVQEDAEGRIWVATHDGLHLFLGEAQGFQVYRKNDRDRHSLSDDQIMSLHQSEDKVLWVGTRLGGVNRWNPDSWKLGALTPPALDNTAVLAFEDAGRGNIWVGAFTTALLQLNAEGEVVRTFDHDSGYVDRGNAPVSALLTDSEGRLWIGTMGEGLQMYLPGQNQLHTLRHEPADDQSLSADGVMSLFEDSQHRIWAGTFGGGLSLIDPQTLTATRYVQGTRISAIREDSSGALWLGTDGEGLIRLEPGSGAVHRFRHSASTAGSLGSDLIFSLHISQDRSLWIGTSGAGLVRLLDTEDWNREPVFEHLTTGRGLANNVIYGILEDSQRQLWLSSNRGLMRFNPESGSIRYFPRAIGLQNEEFNFGAYHKRRDGRFLFGGTGGYNAFDPMDFGDLDQGPTIALTRIEVANKPLKPVAALAGSGGLELDHDENAITFEYAALSFLAPESNLYSVKLEGFDQDWTAPSKRMRSTYTNLDAGRYVFLIRAANGYGAWSKTPLEVGVVINAAPWATPQAYLVYCLLISALLYGFFRWRLRVIEREARIRQLAFYDRRTGLPNLDLFTQRTAAALSETSEDERSLVVITLRLKTIARLRNILGLGSVDELLSTVVPRLTQQLFGSGQSTTTCDLARISETELAAYVLLDDPKSEAGIWATRLCKAISRPIYHDGRQLHVSVFAGIATFPQDGTTATKLIESASTAAQDNDVGQAESFAFYDRSMTRRAIELLSLESDLRQAIREDSLELYLQGKFDCAGVLVGTEALCRWKHPERGSISPGIFVPLAEESDLIMELDAWVIGQVWRRLHHWQAKYPNVFSIAVNVSADTFVTGRIFAVLERLRGQYPLDPSLLEVEITESVLASDLERVTKALLRIKDLGHMLALDDFGTGYSSLTYLQRFPIDKLKIDQAFIRDIETNTDQQALCKAIIALAQSLNLQTIAEGVETQTQQDLLVSLGCDRLQGFYLHRPEPVADFERRFFH